MFLQFLLSLFVIEVVLAQGPPDRKSKLLSFDDCEEKSGTAYDVDMEIKANDNDEMEGFATINLKDDFTDEFTFAIKVDEWKGGKWSEVTNADGNAWENIQKYAKRTYEKMSQLLSPNMPEDVPIPAGEYKLEHFQLEQGDVQLPPNEGLYKAEIRVFNGDGEEVFCKRGEVEMK